MATVYKFADDNTKITAFLQSYFQSGNLNFLIGSGASTPAIAVAGTIEEEIDGLLLAGDENDANLAALNFIEMLASKNTAITASPRPAPIQQALTRYEQLLSLIDRILFERKNVLLPRQANIFTSNYDMFFEYAASMIPTLILNDGFKRSGVVNGDFVFAPESYFDRTYRAASVYSQSAEIPTINLMKFHGSLSWMLKSEQVIYRSVLPKPLSTADKKDPKKVIAKLDEFFLIFPNFRKYHKALVERTYYDLLRLYANALEKENAVLLVFGFSFQDEHILDITRRALRNPTAQVILFAYNGTAVANFQEKFVTNRNVVVIAPADGQTIDFDAFNNLIQTVLPSVK